MFPKEKSSLGWESLQVQLHNPSSSRFSSFVCNPEETEPKQQVNFFQIPTTKSMHVIGGDGTNFLRIHTQGEFLQSKLQFASPVSITREDLYVNRLLHFNSKAPSSPCPPLGTKKKKKDDLKSRLSVLVFLSLFLYRLKSSWRSDHRLNFPWMDRRKGTFSLATTDIGGECSREDTMVIITKPSIDPN